VIANRPFVRLVCQVDGISQPSALWAQVRRVADDAAGLVRPDLEPVVELTLRGQLAFARSALETERIERILQEVCAPLVARVRDLTTVEPGEIAFEAEMGRRELAQHVLREIIMQDARLSPLAEPLTQLALNLQEMALAEPDPRQVVASLERWQEEHGRPFAQIIETAHDDEA
jgi:exoribonuclease R